MAEPDDAADRNENVAERNEVVRVDETTGWFRRVKRCLKDEMTLLARCVGSASPDRSSAAVLFLVLLGVSLTCMLSRYLMASQPGRFPNYVVPWLIIGFEAAATVCLVLMLCYAHNRPSDDCVTDDDLQPWHRFIRRNIKLFGIVPFYFAIFVFDMFRLIAEWTCIDAWMACDSGVVRVEHITDLIYPMARTVYLCVVLIVCVKFNAADFFQNTLVLAGLAVVQATNLSTWLDALLDESAVFLFERNSTYELLRCFNGTDVNVSDHFVQCFSRNTGEYELLESASPYLYPFIMEYLMLVIECVADWFFSDARRHDGTPPPTVASDPPTRPMSPLQHESIASVANRPNADGGTEQVPTTFYIEPQQGAETTVTRTSSSDYILQFDADGRQDDNVPLIGARPNIHVVATTSTIVSQSGFVHVDVDSVTETWYDRCPCFFVSVVLSLIVSFLLVIFGVYNLFLSEIKYRNVFVCYRSAYWLTLSLAAVVGYAASRRLPSGPMNPNGFEYFVILSCIGPIMQSIFTIVANVHMVGFLIPRGMFLTEEITNILHICTQVVFYAYAKSIQIRTFADNEITERELRRKRSILMGVISYFALCNFAIWVEDSFIETHSSATSWQKQYFDNWPLIYNTFNPLSLVFRFNSVLLFLNVLFDKRR